MVDESHLSEAIRTRLAELRACNNIAAVTVRTVSDAGVLAMVVPKNRVGDGEDWAMPDEPFMLLIPNRKH